MKDARDHGVPVRAACIVLVAALAGCLQGSGVELALSSPAHSDGLTIFAAAPGEEPEQGRYVISYQGRDVYPPGGLGGVFSMKDGKGSQFVPYSFFVQGNGRYDVRVEIDGTTATSHTIIEKWVEYVYLHPYYKGSRALVDVQLSRERGGSPTDRVIARGDLIIEVHYRGPDGTLDSLVGTMRETTPSDATFTRLQVPPSLLSRGPGYYAFEATFHNAQAQGNAGVENDPTLAQRSPPWNWLKVGTR